MAHKHFDVIILGGGGMGSATAYELARRGRTVLLLEQFAFGHVQGSSHGQTRIIRRAYYEDPAYVPLVQRAFERWYDLEQQVGRHLLTECGCLNIGPPNGEIVLGVQASAREHRLPISLFGAKAIRAQFPAFVFDEPYVGVLEREAGFLYVDDCVRAHLDAAAQCGATLHSEEPVLRWHAEANRVQVHTTETSYEANSLVITAGAWAGPLLAEHGTCLRVLRQVPMWFQTTNDGHFRRDRFPAFIADTPQGHYYGLPMIDQKGVKVARHYGAAELLSPDGIDRVPTKADVEPVEAFLRQHMPVVGSLQHAEVCLYTLTPDRHFIIDRHPEHPNVVVAAGFSGHGFKFAPVVGEVLADLVLTGVTDWNISRFSMQRPSIAAIHPV